MDLRKEYDSISDEDIVLRIQDGDKGAMDYLMEKYKYLVRDRPKRSFL